VAQLSIRGGKQNFTIDTTVFMIHHSIYDIRVYGVCYMLNKLSMIPDIHQRHQASRCSRDGAIATPISYPVSYVPANISMLVCREWAINVRVS
jgi:hypothetical protein